MEALRNSRKPIRRRATVLIKDLNALLEADPLDRVEVEVQLNRVRENNEILKTFDKQIRDLLPPEEGDDEEDDEDHEENDTDRELASIDKYQNKFDVIRIKVENVLTPPPRQDSPTPSEYSTTTGGGYRAKRQLNLPKIELRKFNGEITEWLSWWAQFQKIHEDDDIDASDKFQYLVQSMTEGTRARELVNTYPQTATNYPKVIDALKERFGKDKLLTQVYVRELLKMVINNAKSKEKVKLSKLFDKLESHIRALESLNVSVDMMSKFLYPMVESSLPEEILIAWQRSPMYEYDGSKEIPPKSELDYLIQFLKKEVEREEQRAFAKSGFESIAEDKRKSETRNSRKREDAPTSASLFNGQKGGCIFCGKPNHASHDCFQAQKMSMEDKNTKVQESKCCFICFKKGHFSKSCKCPIRCTFCEKRHYPIMCLEAEKRKGENQEKQVQKITEGVNSMTVYQTAFSTLRNSLVLMKTLYLRLKGLKGEDFIARLLYDEGSQRSYIRKELAILLGLKISGKVSMQNSLFGGHVTKSTTKQVYKVTVQSLDKQNTMQIELIAEDTICSSCPSIPSGSWFEELAEENISLSDIGKGSGPVDILIGSDLWGKLMTGNMKKLKSGLIAVESLFGWTLSGVLPSEKETSCASLNISMLNYAERSLTELWSLETIGIRDSAEKITKEEHDLRVKEEFKKNITRDSQNRYVVRLPWISGEQPIIPNNRNVAEKRLVSASNKLITQNRFIDYDKCFKDWEREGIIEEVQVDCNTADHYLPHRPVFKPESITTPVRPVFDASCRQGKNPSLIHCLEKGPNLLELIPSILLKFREKDIGGIGDIRKAFQMVGVTEQDRKFQKFLWWENYEKKTMKVYRHCRVVFGLNCSPFILAAVIEHHLDQVKPELKEVAEKLKRSLYVDNCVTSFDTKEDYLKFKEESTAILAEAKMELRQWESNLETSRELEMTSVLGLKWDKVKDALQVQIPKKLNEIDTVTKRSVLSTVSQVYDPLGVTCPALLIPKIMLQDSWAVDSEWDKVWIEEESRKFVKWCEELPELEKLKIPRKSFGKSPREHVELHTFSDASKDAYAAVVFARVESGDQVSVQLLLAKSRVSPLDKKKSKRVTIPRLELLGCLIGSRLTQTVQQSLELSECPVHYWSDSTTALGWIRRDEDWGTFVGNRVREIRRFTTDSDWNHVPGDMNPADLPSRGCSPAELVQSKWWEGPSWLKNKEDWPTSQPNPDEDLINQERKKTSITVAAIEVKQPAFSSYLKNVKVAGWIRRFLINIKKKRVDRVLLKYLTLKELRLGERDVMLQIQKHHRLNLRDLKKLHVELQKDGLLHLKTRLTYRQDEESFKSPVLLPNDDPIVHQLIEYVHRNHCHAGTQFVLGKLREKYWIPTGRKTVGRILNKCVVCRRHSSKNLPCDPAPLPQSRVETQFAFQTTGVDLAGPILLKGGRKCWIVLYTCAVYRGVYLDIVDLLSSDDFLDSLQKFTWIIGRPSTFISDNGTNFVGAQTLLKTVDWKKMEEKFQVKQIRWMFNPPSAPWWGGWWERLVRTVKDLLRKMIGTAKLTRKELEMCLGSISYTINNRPLTTLTEDIDDLIPLTPAMFMKDIPISGLPEREAIETKDLQDAYQKLRNIKKSLNERFRKEYLAQLIQRKNEKSCPDPQVGDVVLVGQENKKRFEWPLGRILELYPGKDGKFRVARVKTTRGILTRPLQRLYPLEVTSYQPIVVPDEVQLKAKEVKAATADQIEEVAPIIKTRSGREVKKVSRYGKWNE